jgi:hypothetical protein
MKARIRVKQGNLAADQVWADAQGIPAKGNLGYLREFGHITLARLLIARYRDNHDHHVLGEARDYWNACWRRRKDRRGRGARTRSWCCRPAAQRVRVN